MFSVSATCSASASGSPLLHSYTGLKYNLQLAGWHEGLTLHMQLCQIQQHNQEMKPLV